MEIRLRLAAAWAAASLCSAGVASAAGPPDKPSTASPAAAATLTVSVTESKGAVYLDDKLVGEGAFSGEVTPGSHKLRVIREGYESFEETLSVNAKETLSRTVTLRFVSRMEPAAEPPKKPAIAGVYGGFGLFGVAVVGGMKNGAQRACDDGRPNLVSCTGGGEGSGGLSGFVGYHFRPVGVELYFGAQYDASSPTIEWAASGAANGADPARTEAFVFRRAGGFGAVRARYTLQNERFRFSVAAGIGLSHRVAWMERPATLKSDPKVVSNYGPDASQYTSPLFSLEPSAQLRLTPGVALTLSLMLQIESVGTFGSTPTTPADPQRKLGTVPLSTPEYDLTSGAQVFFGPTLGVMFGP